MRSRSYALKMYHFGHYCNIVYLQNEINETKAYIFNKSMLSFCIYETMLQNQYNIFYRKKQVFPNKKMRSRSYA